MTATNCPKYVDYVYDILKKDCEGLDSVYEDYVKNQIGTIGLNALLENGLLEGCGVLYGRQLYMLVERES